MTQNKMVYLCIGGQLRRRVCGRIEEVKGFLFSDLRKADAVLQDEEDISVSLC
jgi:hypothetical protein